MTKLTVFAFVAICSSHIAFAQLQTADGEGSIQSGSVKRLYKKAKYGASLLEQQFSFKTGKGIDGSPVVVAL